MAAKQGNGYLKPGEGILVGAAVLITLYGLVLVFSSAIADKEPLPESVPQVGLLIVGLLVAGAVLGGLWERLRG